MPEAGIALRGGGNSRLRIDPTDIKGEGGPVYPRIVVPLKLDLSLTGGQQDQPYTVLAIECGLFLKDHLLRISDALPVTELSAVRYSGVSTFWTLQFPLDPYRVNAIEARRHGDLNLRFDLAFVAGFWRRVNTSDKTNEQIDVLSAIEKVSSQTYVEVPQSHWVTKVLPNLGSNAYFVVEIPTRNKHITAAWDLIEQAEAAFCRWDTKAVFAHCREAAGALTNVVDNNHAQTSFLRSERWNRAVKEFNHFSSLDLHLEEIKAKNNYTKEEVRVEKSDAECLLIFVKALAKYAEELVRPDV